MLWKYYQNIIIIVLCLYAEEARSIYQEWIFSNNTFAGLTPNTADVNPFFGNTWEFVYDQQLVSNVLSLTQGQTPLRVRPYIAGTEGRSVRDYTLIFTIKPKAFDTVKPLFNTFPNLDEKAQLYFRPDGAIGLTDDVLTPGNWTSPGMVSTSFWSRIGLTCEKLSNRMDCTIYVNETFSKAFSISHKSDYALYDCSVLDDWFVLFADSYVTNSKADIFVSRIQFWDKFSTALEIFESQYQPIANTPPVKSEWNFLGNYLPSTLGTPAIDPQSDGVGSSNFVFDYRVNRTVLEVDQQFYRVFHNSFASRSPELNINYYTMTFDIFLTSNGLFPVPLINTNDTGSRPAQIVISSTGSIGILQTSQYSWTESGIVPLEQWVQIGMSINTYAGEVRMWVNGTKVLSTTFGNNGQDGIWSLPSATSMPSWFVIFKSQSTTQIELARISIARLRFWDSSLSDFQMNQVIYYISELPPQNNTSSTSSTVSNTTGSTSGESTDASTTQAPDMVKDEDSTYSTGLVVGLSVGVPCSFVIFGVLLIVAWRRRAFADRNQDSSQQESGSMSSSRQSLFFRATISPDYEPRLSSINRNSVLTSSTHQSSFTPVVINDTIALLGKLGKGQFGEVIKGRWHQTEVAMKGIPTGDTESFLKEVELLVSLNHPNIVHFYGLYKNGNENYIVMDYYPKGSVLDLLHKKGSELSFKSRMEMLISAAKGMTFLESKGILHLDLATRNLLVTKTDGRYESKISDFGLSRSISSETSGAVTFPIRWTAPECFQSSYITSKSDVWSFGIVIWEVFANGVKPYPDVLDNKQVIELVKRGERLSCPIGCPKELYDIMLDCWREDPKDRPSFPQIVSRLENFNCDDSLIVKRLQSIVINKIERSASYELTQLPNSTYDKFPQLK